LETKYGIVSSVRNKQYWLWTLLGFFLPLHGILTVLVPDVRFWKEGILIVFLFVILFSFLTHKETISSFFKKLEWLEKIALLFLSWLGVLLLLQSGTSSAIISVRYLGFGFLTFLVGSIWWRYDRNPTRIFESFAWGFLSGCAISVCIGIWGQYLGGFEILRNFYSPTISSWVPGQTIPLYHEVGGIIRMQGGSSGPIEFSHLLLAGIFLILFSPFSQKYKSIPLRKYVCIGFVGIFLLGIFLSFSRMAIVLSLGAGAYFFLIHCQGHWKKISIGIFLGIFLLGTGVFFAHKNIIQRIGDSFHFTRPLQAIEKGLTHPLTGNLGSLGPAARIHNLAQKNDDKALIAENIFADVFAQTGIIGLLIFLLFWGMLFWKTKPFAWPFLVASFCAGNMATLFDMTPLSMSFFLIFAFFVKMSKIPPEKETN
jgi:hypothetical protein